MSNLYYQLLIAKFKPTDECIFYNDVGFSYTDLISKINQNSLFLIDKGVICGESVGILLPNTPIAVSLFYAINKIGAVSNVVLPSAPVSQIVDNFKSTNTKIAFVASSEYDRVKDYLRDNNIDVFVCDSRDILDNVDRAIRDNVNLKLYDNSMDKSISKRIINEKKDIVIDELFWEKEKSKYNFVDSDNVACYMHSAGTISEKTVLLTNRGLNVLTDMTKEILEEIQDDECTLVTSPFFHCLGLGLSMHACLTNGIRICLIDNFNAENALKTIKKHRVSFFIGVPSALAKMANSGEFIRSIGSVKKVYCGGDRLKEEVAKKYQNANVAVYEGYGLTEATGLLTSNTNRCNKSGSVGKPLSGVNIAIVDQKLKPLAVNELGEIAFNAISEMKGYLPSDDKKILPELKKADINGEKYILTGDIGYVDIDGYLHFVERKKRVLKISGFNVFLEDIERLIEKVDGVNNCLAYSKIVDGKTRIFVDIVTDKDFDKIVLSINNLIIDNKLKYYKIYHFNKVDKIDLTSFGKQNLKLSNKQK